VDADNAHEANPAQVRTPVGFVESPTRQSVRRMTDLGMNPRQISAALGISTQRVYYLLAILKRESEEATA